VLRRGAFAFSTSLTALLSGGVALVQHIDEIVPVRSIDVGGDFDFLHDPCPQRAVRGPEMTVVRGLADATALHEREA